MRKIKTWLETKSHVVWDWNGTLLADVDHAVDTVNVLLREERLPQIDKSTYRKKFGFPVIDYYKELGFDTSTANFHRLCERFNDLFHAGLPGLDLWPGAREVLSEIKAQGKTQSLLSASEHGLLLESLKLFQVGHLFDHVTGIADKKAGSKLEFGRKLLERSGHRAEDTILIGDTDHDLEVANALGVDMILVDHGHQCELRLKDLHPHVVKVI
ncbi:MAG: HAD family hydrolase [Bdellovibrionales bacterium]